MKEIKNIKGMNIKIDGDLIRLLDGDFLFKFHPSLALGECGQLIMGIEINVTDLQQSYSFYKKLGFQTG